MMESSEKKGADGNRIIDEKLFRFFSEGGMMRDGYVVVFDDPELNKMLGSGIIFPTEVQAREFVTDPEATPFVVRRVKVGLGIPDEALDEMKANVRKTAAQGE